MTMIYKIVTVDIWRNALTRQKLAGMPVDIRDGYIHFSTAHQLRQTAEKHFSGQDDLILLGVWPETLAEHLKWEPARGGDLFPHLYAELPTAVVDLAIPLPLGADGHHRFPEDIP